ncbi:hypothetical protein ACFOOK_26235 [Micromonospora krabiensis]|uniref:Minor tail protein n=1 Tax=Micromonospora krabiensis TaxID=307121 RepID=A0A1C3N5S6_9ACTN|nr:hypothetical protein [Micromonospora krabiensis]SBV27934.1 hypothetical protein GA0070620_3465 [Micromonospora krabiensis]
MAITAFPFDTQDTSESDYSRLMGEAVDDGIVGSQGSTGFQVSAGSGMTVVAAAGTATLRGFMGFSTITEGPVTVANGDASYLRIDLAILRLDRANNNMIFTVKQGTASATPAPPTLTQTDTGIHEIALARLDIPAGAGAMQAGYITDLRQFLGSTTGTWTTAGRPANPRKGKLGLNVTRGMWEYHNGSQWVDLIPSTVTNATKWNNYGLIVQAPQPTPQPNTIWIQPI